MLNTMVFTHLPSNVLLVLIPSIISAVYLYTRAADQYASYVGFSVRSESASSRRAVLLAA